MFKRKHCTKVYRLYIWGVGPRLPSCNVTALCGSSDDTTPDLLVEDQLHDIVHAGNLQSPGYLPTTNEPILMPTANMAEPPKTHPSEFLEFKTIPSYLTPISSASSSDPIYPQSPTSTTTTISQVQLNNDLHQSLIASVPGFPELAREAKAGTTSEHHMTLLEGIRLYPKAILWCLLLSLTIVMEGFDITLVSSFFAFPAFARRYGRLTEAGDYQVTPAWQSALTNGAVVGEILGLLCNGYMTDRFGNRVTMLLALGLLCACTFLVFFATGVEMLLASQILSGIPWGVFQTLSTTYAAEVMPVALRAYLTSNVNLCWLVGQLVSVGMLRGLIQNEGQWSYRIPFALQWAWAIPILAGVVFAPESPWWLIQHERPDKARKALLRLTSRSHDEVMEEEIGEKVVENGRDSSETVRTTTRRRRFDASQTVAMMQHTNEVEKYLSADGSTSYASCFRGPDLRRTEISCMVWVTQAICAVMIGNAAYFYEQAGLSSSIAFDLSIIMYAVGVLGSIFSWALMRWFGRRTLYLWGCGLCSVALLAAGIVGAIDRSKSAGWVLGSLVVVNTFVYDSTIGPVCYSLVAEIPASRLRVKTVVLARVSYNLTTLVGNILMPKMLNPTAWDWKGRTCLVWAALSAACCVWCWFRLPEPKGLTYMELDILFQKGAGARKFKKLRGKLAETGYFSLCKGPEGKDDRHEWGHGRT